MNDTDLPSVTVITGFYNRGRLLDRTVQSLLDQTYPNLEIIVFDDCSSDDTRERLEAYRAKNDPRLKIVIHEQNVGFTRGMVAAIEQASGEYIAVHGSGDEAMPTRIEEQARLLRERPEVGVVGCWYENVVEEQGIVRLRQPDADSVTPESLTQGNVFSHGEVMFRRSVYDAAGGYRPVFRFCQDYDLWLRMIGSARFATVREMLYRRYVQFEGVSYVPAKAILQARYFLICQRMARASEAARAGMLARLEAEGPTALVELNDAELQKRVFRACLRLIAWGNPAQAKQYSANLVNPIARWGIALIGAVVSSRFLSAPRKIAFRALGIRGGQVAAA